MQGSHMSKGKVAWHMPVNITPVRNKAKGDFWAEPPPWLYLTWPGGWLVKYGGYFDSSFVIDPNTLTLGETKDGAVVAGCRFGGEMIDA